MPDRIAQRVRPVPTVPGWVIESCTFTWIFDLGLRRFRRVPLGTSASGPVSPGDWTAYDRIDLRGDLGCFAVTLNPEGTRIVRSWLHVDPCARCGPASSQPASTVELAEMVARWRAELRAVDVSGRRETGSCGGTPRPRRLFSPRGGWRR